MKKKKSSLHSCNVLENAAAERRLWQFSGNGKASLVAEHTVPHGKELPARVVAKTWRSLWQPKLNIAWLPADQVFLRVLHLPAAEFSELVSMVDFQLEKVSPLPVNQIVWSIELLPPVENVQPVIVILVARSVVEEFLGAVEAGGFLPDRLELPHIHQLLGVTPDQDAVQVSPLRETGRTLVLVAWWTGGLLRDLEMLHLPDAPNQPELLVKHLTKTAWAGELEGWYQRPLICRLMAVPAEVSIWEPALKKWSGQPIETVEPLSGKALAELSAGRAAREETKANLLPVEFSARYRQQFVDRLWMSGLGALTVAYIFGVIIYFGFLQFITYQKNDVEAQVAALSGSYTNAVKMKARADVLQNQLNLKFAALDCLRAASEHLPGELTLTLFTFSRGQTLNLHGTAPADQVDPIYDYNARLRSTTVNGEPLFSKVEQPQYRQQGQTIAWNFSCELNRPASQ